MSNKRLEVGESSWTGPPDKIHPHHFERLAMVFVRQSTLQQVTKHQESTQLQYSLVERAQQYGWARERILIIDEDLGLSGRSAAGRPGFQRLLQEVALHHVGLVLGVEISRLARCSRDWHQLLELCSRFGTLIADWDGLYNPAHYNDRLLLGLKGTMSEAELHILRQRLDEGKLQKARRGELGKPVPSGYLRHRSGEVTLDPDEEVQAVVRLIFDQFDRIGSINGLLRHLVDHQVQIGIRLRTGPDIGRLEWRRPHRQILSGMLKNPIYAGTYAYGRRQTDPRKQKPGRSGSGRSPELPPEQWKVCLHDRLPAYITWEHYLRNQKQLATNRSRAASQGAVREGFALLQGLLTCGRCGHRMQIRYGKQRASSYAHYFCNYHKLHYGEAVCQSFSAARVDEIVGELALSALRPGALELSLKMAQEIEAERDQVEDRWQKRLQRADYEAERAERQYRVVEPENRLVARSLESFWEEKLQEQKALQEEYRRFQQRQPRSLTLQEREQIRELANNLPVVWQAATTTPVDRKKILRFLINQVVASIQGRSEQMSLEVHWSGGHCTTHQICRPVGRLEQLSNFKELLERIRTLRSEGYPAHRIAEILNSEGWITATQRNSFNERVVRAIIHRHNLGPVPKGVRAPPSDNPNEWWLSDLAAELEMPRMTLYGWLRRGQIQGRRDGAGGPWIVFCDGETRSRFQAKKRQRGRGNEEST